MWFVTKFIGDGPTEIIVDRTDTESDALLLCHMYTEQHFNGIMPDRGQSISAWGVSKRTVGYRFVTNNGTLVTYAIREK